MTGTVSESVVGSYIFFFHIAFPVNKLTISHPISSVILGIALLRPPSCAAV